MSTSETDAFDITAYRWALGGFATGVCVVTAHTPDGPYGITINSFTSVSLKPPLVLWCLDRASDRHDGFAGAERFAVHMLPVEDREMSDRFAWGICRLSNDEFDSSSIEPPCPGNGPDWVPVPSRSPVCRLQPPLLWWASICATAVAACTRIAGSRWASANA